MDSSFDLLQRLMTLAPRVTQSFLFQAVELREKLCKLGEEDKETIQRRFLRSLETGLLSDAVKFKLKHV